MAIGQRVYSYGQRNKITLNGEPLIRERLHILYYQNI